MELRLQIPREAGRTRWTIELLLPPCRESSAFVVIDVGGRTQKLDMRGMGQRRRVTAELSVQPYRIISFTGKPDPLFVDGVEKECPGLPNFGAAVFAATGIGELKSFPRARELRCSETFALLWKAPVEPSFPDELVIDWLPSRQGWHLVLVTIPDCPSSECTTWLQTFTGLHIAQPAPSIIPVWPFQTRSASVNVVECARSQVVLLSAQLMPVEHPDHGPTMQVQSTSGKLSAVGVEQSPAFFSLKPGSTDFIRVATENTLGIQAFFSFSLPTERLPAPPSVELAFTSLGGVHRIVSLHQRKCAEIASEARELGIQLEYVSMPPGATGIFRIDGPAGRSVTALFPGTEVSPHSRYMRLLLPDVLAKLVSALADPAYHVEIEFGGFGRLYLAGNGPNATASDICGALTPALRSRLLSFIRQLRLATPVSVGLDDASLVKALDSVRPELPLISHYRSLVKEVLASGFELKQFR